MSTERSIRRYAQALFSLSLENKSSDQIYSDSQILISAIDQSHELSAFLNNPIVPPAKRQEILKEIFEKKVHSSTLKFILFLESKQRLNILKDVLTLFREFHLEHKNILKVVLISRWELSKDEVSSITDHLKFKFKKEILPEFKINADILGGIKVQIGDVVYDHSLATQLNKFKNNVIWN